jgi:hypothetical protein
MTDGLGFILFVGSPIGDMVIVLPLVILRRAAG